jgi:pimeloyl-ACP methyl ester carboxylesterase
LSEQPDIDKKRIGLMGHSEGGVIAPLAAAKSKKVAYVVLLAAPGLVGKDVIAAQAAAIARAAGAGGEDVAAAQKQREQLWKMIKAEKDPDKLRADIEAFLIEDLRRMAGDADVDDGSIEQAARFEAERSASRWFRDFLFRDPAKPLRKVKVPVLAVTGSKDLQVDAEANLPAIEKTLRKAGNKDVTTKALPGLNHLLQQAETGLPGEYASIEQTVDPGALGLVTSWIRAHTGLEAD